MKLDESEITGWANGGGTALTLDNLHLSRLRNDPPDDPDSRSNEGGPAPAEDQSPPVSVPFRAGDCTLGAPDPVPGQVAALVEASIADSTRRAYRTDLAHFAAWGGQLPAEPAQVASFLAAHAQTLSVATLVRRIATISKAHEARGLRNPCRSEIVRATLRGVKRTRGIAQREAKPLLREDLFRVLDAMGEGVKDARDRALLLIGFAGGFRRSEIVAPRLRRRRARPAGADRHAQALEDRPGRRGAQGRHPLRPNPALPGPRPRPLACRLPGSTPAPSSGPSTGMAASPPSGCRAKPCRSSSRSASPPPASTRPASPATACAPASPPAQCKRASRRSRSDRRPATPSDAMLARYVRDGELFVGNAAGALL